MLRFLTKVQMTVTTESGGRQNAFPTETRPYICLLYKSHAADDLL